MLTATRAFASGHRYRERSHSRLGATSTKNGSLTSCRGWTGVPDWKKSVAWVRMVARPSRSRVRLRLHLRLRLSPRKCRQ